MDYQSFKKHAADILKASLAAALVTFLTSMLQMLASFDFGASVHALQAGAGFVALKATQIPRV